MENNRQQGQLLSELKEARYRASYWKQRAKSAEGHLFASDARAIAVVLHLRTSHKSTPWEELPDAARWSIEGATAAIVSALEARRHERLPKWPDFAAAPVEYQCGCGDIYPSTSFGAGYMAANNGVCENCDVAKAASRSDQ